MLKKNFKRLAFVSLSFLFVFSLVFKNLPKQKAFSIGNVICTQAELENYYSDIYTPWYVSNYNEQPLSLYEMLDSTSGFYMDYTNEQVINEVMRQLIYEVNYDISPLLDNSYNQGYNTGYSLGEDSGYDTGYSLGEDSGIKKGKVLGYKEYENDKGSSIKFKDLVFGVIDAPFNVIKNALNFEIFGINLANVILFLISTSLVFFVIRFFMKGN